MKSYQFNLEGLHCASCLKIINKRVGRIAGVSEVAVDLQGNLSVKAEGDLARSDLTLVLKDTDYKVL